MQFRTRAIRLGCLAIGLIALAGPARSQQGSTSGWGYATGSGGWSNYGPATAWSGYAPGSVAAPAPAATPTYAYSPGWTGYAPGQAWAGYAPQRSWYAYNPQSLAFAQVARLNSQPPTYRPAQVQTRLQAYRAATRAQGYGFLGSTAGSYRELGTGRSVPLAKPWLPGSP